MYDTETVDEWFVLREMFQSPEISESFDEKIKNLNFVLDKAEHINEIFEEKCVDKNVPQQ